MRVYGGSDPSSLVAKQAIVLYEPEGRAGGHAGGHAGGQGGGSIATLHAITLNENMPTMGAGKVMRMHDLRRFMRSICESSKESLEFMPEEVLAFNGPTVVWWHRPATRRVWFNFCEGSVLHDRTGVVPHPGLVFTMGEFGWRVWAVKGKDRPGMQTLLHQAPYGNVYDDGEVCAGNVELPRQMSVGMIGAMNAAFFDSKFTHANVKDARKLARFKGGVEGLWGALLEGDKKRFPESALVSKELTLGEMLSRMNRNLRK